MRNVAQLPHYHEEDEENDPLVQIERRLNVRKRKKKNKKKKKKKRKELFCSPSIVAGCCEYAPPCY